jgi:hypothetical protein
MSDKYVACIKPSLTRHTTRREDDANIPRMLAGRYVASKDFRLYPVMADNSGLLRDGDLMPNEEEGALATSQYLGRRGSSSLSRDIVDFYLQGTI